MNGTFGDGFTKQLAKKMSDFEEKIYNIEDGLSSLEENESDIIAYLKDIRCSMPLGLALRRYLCGKFSNGFNTTDKCFEFDIGSDKVIVKDYREDDYDISVDDIKEYTDIFMYIMSKYNTDTAGNMTLSINKAEARRMLRVTTSCQRSKMFLLSFALHMNNDEMNKFLTDVLAEQSYNYRNPEEVIAFYCHSHEDVNNYNDFCRLKAEFENKKNSSQSPTDDERANYTQYAKLMLSISVNDEQELMEFLISNIPNYNGYSKTSYNEFMQLYTEALDRTDIQALSNDEYLMSSDVSTVEQRIKQEDRINKAIGLQKVTNTEQLARRMLQCIPRATSEKTSKDGKKVITNDFISISNGENGQKNKKIQTTTLPKEITMNLLMKDRLDDLIRQIKPVDRKDLVFLKFYLLSLDLQEKETAYSTVDYQIFMDECNDMLIRCGMSRLYPANRFENLILISLVSSNPFEMFEDIIESSFFNEPGTVSE